MQRVTKREQANRAYFRNEIERFLESRGAVRNDLAGYPYNLLTRLGTLGIHPYETWVACRWEDVQRALQEIGPLRMNPVYSGKWNHTYGSSMFKRRDDAQLAVEDFRAELGRYLLDDSPHEQAVASAPSRAPAEQLSPAR